LRIPGNNGNESLPQGYGARALSILFNINCFVLATYCLFEML